MTLYQMEKDQFCAGLTAADGKVVAYAFIFAKHVKPGMNLFTALNNIRKAFPGCTITKVDEK